MERLAKTFMLKNSTATGRAALLGAIFSAEMKAVRDEGRICEIEPLPGVRVDRSWDLGMRDDTCVWFFSSGRNPSLSV